MKALQNGPGSNEAPQPCENVRLSGRFLAKLVRLMEDIQQIRCVTFARE
jgi:hypothetical protein